ncbi:hypothetical protein ACHAPT_010957 [Fusarium lateritium]
MTQRKGKSVERRRRAEETERWVQDGERHVNFADQSDVGREPHLPTSDGENSAAPSHASFETEWNALVEQHRVARRALHDIENKMWELQYSRHQISTEVSSTCCLHAAGFDPDTEEIENGAPELESEVDNLEGVGGEQVELDVNDEEEEWMKEVRRGQNIWARFNRHSQPRPRSTRKRHEQKPMTPIQE